MKKEKRTYRSKRRDAEILRNFQQSVVSDLYLPCKRFRGLYIGSIQFLFDHPTVPATCLMTSIHVYGFSPLGLIVWDDPLRLSFDDACELQPSLPCFRGCRMAVGYQDISNQSVFLLCVLMAAFPLVTTTFSPTRMESQCACCRFRLDE